MSTIKLYIRFSIKLKQINNRGLVAVHCRVTFNNKRKDFSTGLFVNPNHWNSKK